MVKVVNRKPAKEVVKNATCKGCGAGLEYVPNDVQSYHGKDISGGPDGAEWIVCPDCYRRVILKSW